MMATGTRRLLVVAIEARMLSSMNFRHVQCARARAREPTECQSTRIAACYRCSSVLDLQSVLADRQDCHCPFRFNGAKYYCCPSRACVKKVTSLARACEGGCKVPARRRRTMLLLIRTAEIIGGRH